MKTSLITIAIFILVILILTIAIIYYYINSTQESEKPNIPQEIINENNTIVEIFEIICRIYKNKVALKYKNSKNNEEKKINCL